MSWPISLFVAQWFRIANHADERCAQTYRRDAA
jgi:hypothetical protein